MLEDMSQRSVMMHSLLHGEIRDAWTLWEIANYLRLPTEGPFVVIAVETLSVGFEALPEIESKLRSLDVFSAWWLLPDLHAGIAHVASELHLDRITALLTRTATGRVGVSACFEDLRDAPHALHFARVSLRGRADPTTKGCCVRGLYVGHCRRQRPGHHGAIGRGRAELFRGHAGRRARDTFRDVAGVAGHRFLGECHRQCPFLPSQNGAQAAVPDRPAQGRSLSRPRDVTELCLALEVRSWLM